MRILLSWLREFVEIHESPRELAAALTMAGMAVDAVLDEGGDTVLEMDITSNRPDAMNHHGMAREIAALYRRPLKPLEIRVSEGEPQAAAKVAIEVQDPELCSRYSARVALGVEIRPSPDWMRKRLELCGIRSINNIADLTNYVLLELGHPTHAFDLDRLEGSKILVRRGKPGELLRTLDGVDRTLAAHHLVIADARRAIALAGIMGGLETEISDSTRNVLFESAWFQPFSIRKTARHFGMHTEASHRFERGADVGATVWAADRIAALLPRVSGGTVLAGCLDAHPGRGERSQILLRRAAIARQLGLEIPAEEVETILRALGFGVTAVASGWQLTPPSHRLDVEREIDSIEEVARIYGYEKFAPHLPQMGVPAEQAPFTAEEARVRETVRALGYDETISYAFVSAEEAAQFGSGPPVPLKNPLSELGAVMRNSAIPSMLRAVEWNLNRNEADLRLMEIGRVYERQDGSYREPAVLALAGSGLARPASLAEKAKPFDIYELKADVSEIVAGFDIQQLSFDDREVPAHYLAGGSARVLGDGELVAYFGQLDPERAAERKIRQPVFLAEIFLDALFAFGLRRPQHRPLPRVPAVHRDFSLFVPEGIQFSEIRAAVGQQEFLAGVEPVEVFRGDQVPPGCYSLLLRAVWQKGSENLTDEEVNRYAGEVVENLNKKLGIEQRA